jgi:hypothetical protein
VPEAMWKRDCFGVDRDGRNRAEDGGGPGKDNIISNASGQVGVAAFIVPVASEYFVFLEAHLLR